MITVIFLSTLVFSLARSEFQILHHQRLSPWITYYSPDDNDCSEKGRFEQFPHIYSTHNDSSITIGSPLNFTVDSFNREALELGGKKNYFYPGVAISFYPPQYGFESVTGYEVLLRRNRGCVVMDFTNTHWSQEKRIEVELFPLYGLVHYQLTLSSLPKYNETSQSETSHFTTGQYAKYRNVDRSLPPSANWYADVAYDIITAMVTGNATTSSIEIVFSKPPVQYNFELFEITLVPKDGGSNVRRAKTPKLFHVFENVPAGKYKVMIKPVDEFFSHAGRCLCRQADGACSNCISATMEAVVP